MVHPDVAYVSVACDASLYVYVKNFTSRLCRLAMVALQRYSVTPICFGHKRDYERDYLFFKPSLFR